jgi:hypothetical protein
MSLDDLDTAARWQAIAADALVAAAKATDPEAKATLLIIAAGYERLAERAMERDSVEVSDPQQSASLVALDRARRLHTRN